MDYIKFIPQIGFSSQAIELSTYDKSKRSNLKSIYNEASEAGQKIIVKDIILDNDAMVMRMTLGIEDNTYMSKIKMNVDKDTTFLNLFPTGYKLYGILIESTIPSISTPFRVTINHGSLGDDDLLRPIITDARLDEQFYFEAVEIPYTIDPVNIISSSWLTGSSLNIRFLFKKQ